MSIGQYRNIPRADGKLFGRSDYPPAYAPPIRLCGKGLRTVVDKWWADLEKSEGFLLEADIFPSVVEHESDRRKRKTLPKTESGFPKAIDRAKQANAGTAKVGGQRQGYPKHRRKKAERQSGLESPPVIRGSRRESLPTPAGSSPTCRECSGNGMPSGADPRNGLGKVRPTAVQSGNRQAALLGVRSRRKLPR